MAMQATAIRFAPEERQWIQAYADMMGKSFSDVVRESVMETIEDAIDTQEYMEAIADDDGVRHSLKDVVEELG